MSASKFHLRPGSGEPGPCSAQEGNCPYGADAPHFNTEKEARESFELAQGGSFATEPETRIRVTGPLLEDIAHRIQEQQRRWSGSWVPDKSGTYSSGVGRLNDIAAIGGGRIDRELGGKKVNDLAKDMYGLRNSKDPDMALSARVFYATMIYELQDNGLKDMRSDGEKESDEIVYRYDNQPEGKNLSELEAAGLQGLRRTALKQVSDLTDEDAGLIRKHSQTRSLLDISTYIEQAKTLKSIDKTFEEFDTLPAHVVDALGSKYALGERAEILAKSVNAQEQILRRIVGDVDREIERREKNAEIMALLKAEAK